ncbi:hypothetical protein BS47DRAFT_1392104 [Hydnum rufescens UP504]|uniref:Uncharacterized protein n=1 Tax=Hydnum rufescens UP504 TaxID=1448309 RepID=A0A9P6DXH1_9AGAM|nr:hypothetical protein BS47DRAFT_1392104 [Hydnum rufescens UP504]
MLVSPTPAASLSGSSQKVFPKFQKKVNTSTPASTTCSTVEPKKSLPMDTLDNSRPLQWWLGEPLTPMKPIVVSILESYGEEFPKTNLVFKDAIGEWPISDDCFVSIRGWVLEYTNTLWEKDMSEELLGLLENPGTVPARPPFNLLFSGLNSMLPGETLHRHWPESPCDVRSWQQPHSAWSFIDKLCVRHIYNCNAPHRPYLLQHQTMLFLPFGKVCLTHDWYLNNCWISEMRRKLIFTFDCYCWWLEAAQFFLLDLNDSRDQELLEAAQASYSKHAITKEVVAIEDTEAEMLATARLLMHRTLNHIAFVYGLEPPRFGVNHSLISCFFIMDNVDVPVAKLERHSVPLHGIRVLEEREVHPLDSFSSVSDPETQEAAERVAERTEPHGDFVEIWKMSRAAEVKHPSPWYIQYLIFVSDNNQSIWSIFNGLFGAGLREVDSAMAATLANLLGPSSVTLCHVVPLPSHKTSPPEGKGELVAIDAEIDLDEEPTPPNLDHEDLTPQVDPMTNLPEWNDLDSDLSVEDDEEPRLNDMEITAKACITVQIEKAQNEDPLWAQVTADLGLALAGNADAHECILLMVLAAQSKRQHACIRRIDLKLPAVAYPVVSMVHNNILRVITAMLHITPPIVRHLLIALPVGLILIPPHVTCLLPASVLLIASIPLLAVPLLAIPLLAIPLLAIPLLAIPLLAIPLLAQYGPEMEINHQEQEKPVCPVVSPPDPGDSKMQDVQQAVPPPQDHMPVDPPFQAALPIALPLLPCDEQGGTNEVGLEPSGETVEDLDPLVVVGDWYRIEFFGVTADIDIKAIFQLLMHDGLLGVRVRKNKTAKGLARKKQKVLLAFKSQQRWDLILEQFVSGHYLLWEFEQAVSTSPSDLATLLEHVPPHREIGDLQELHPFPLPPGTDASLWHYICYRFLDFYRYPPVNYFFNNPARKFVKGVFAMCQVVTYQKSQLRVPKHKAFDDPSEEPSSSGAQESSKINVTSQELLYPQINIGRRKVDDEANDEVSDETANMEKLGPPGGNWRNKKFRVIASTPSQPPKNRAYIQLESHPKIPEVEYQHESWRSASLLNRTPTSSQVDYPNDTPLLPIQSSEPECASSTFGYNEEPTVLLSGSCVRLSSVVDISSDDGGSMPESDMPDQLLDEARRIGDPRKLLDDAQMLALNLPTSIPEACPGDLLYVWDATQVDTLLWSLPDQGADPSEDCEFVDHTLNHVFQGVNVSRLAKEMRQGPCGTLGIVEGLAFFANTRSLKLEQFEIKILKLVKALKKSSNPESQPSVLPLSGSRPSVNPATTSTHPSAPVPVPPIRHPKDQVLPSIQLPATDAHTLPTLKSTRRKQLRVPFKVPYGKGKGVEAISEDEVESRDADLGSDIEAGVSDIEDDDDINDTQLSSDGEGQPHQPQYNRGPFPTALVDEVHGVTEAFHHTLEAMAKKYNCPLHQVLRLANLGDSFHSKRLPNPFNGYSRKRKLAGLPKLSPGGLRLEYAKEKERFNGDADGLEAWLDDLGTKLTKYIHRKKKLLMGEIQHMATFDAHVVAFVVCSRPDAYADHAQNAILFGSSEIQQLAEKQFNLKKSLEELFIKLMNEQLDATGISKWHEEAEKSFSDFEIGSSSGFEIGSSSEFKIRSSSRFKIGSSSKFKIGSSSGFKIGSSSKFKIGASSEFEFELFGNFEFGLFNGFEFGTFSDFEFGSFHDIEFKSCGHNAPWCWFRWCLEL